MWLDANVFFTSATKTNTKSMKSGLPAPILSGKAYSTAVDLGFRGRRQRGGGALAAGRRQTALALLAPCSAARSEGFPSRL